MSAHAFLLDGWDDSSIWGLDVDHYYAQLTPNGIDDSDGPQIWIAPPTYVIGSAAELLRVIATALDLPAASVDRAMASGLAVNRGEHVGPVTVSGGAPQPPVDDHGATAGESTGMLGPE